MTRTVPVVLQQAFACVVCFILIGATLSVLTVRFSLFDALRLSFDPFVSIMLSYFFVLMPTIYASLLVGRIFYRAIILTLVGVATFGISNLPRIAL